VKLTGGCHCGAIRFRAEGDPAGVGICHCRDCQTFSGAPWRASIPVAAADLVIEQGAPQVYIKTAESGRRRAQGFCGSCGSSIYATEADDPQVYNLRLGAVDQRAELPPQRQSWCGSALAWAQDIREIPPTD